MKRKFTVAIRREIDLQVKPEAEQIDGKTYDFQFGWNIGNESSIYEGEQAWLPDDETYPIDAPLWIASGDLK